jgi:short-subunit dehydrogenase
MSTNTQKGTALITGASTGIGAIYADRLARRGHDLLLVARDTARLDALATRLKASTGQAVETLTADLTEESDLLALEKRLRSDSAISILVNNAGIGVLGPLETADPDRLDGMIDLNVTALTRLSAAAAANFAPRGIGTIINVASALALYLQPWNASYAGTKAYVLAFSQALNQELEPRGVKVQVVLPGAVRTAFWAGSGVELENLPEGVVMSGDDLVDAALAGLDSGELVTIPSLPDAAEWERLDSARQELTKNISRKEPAERYLVAR